MKIGRVFPDLLRGLGTAVSVEEGLRLTVRHVVKLTGADGGALRFQPPRGPAYVVVFDARKIADQATFDDPHRYPVGVEHVMVNGRFVIKDGEHTGSLPGRVLSPS